MKVLLTGRPGIGKTTVIKKVLKKLGDKAIGFYTEEIRDKSGKRAGFRIVTTDGKTGILSHKDIKSPFKVSSYGVDITGFENLVLPVLEKAKQEKRIVVIDEIGKMELFSDRFVEIVEDIFSDDNLDMIATVPLKNVHPIISQMKRSPKSVVIEVTKENRDNLTEKIVRMLKIDER